ncbi:MAG TPA: LysR family transcriptional regulator [Caproiciproducens sp.]|nr:LysR family transcriptional regulator [Caproiciproducens sp.]
MDLKQFGYFVAIAEEGSISAAAKKLHISQPPLSQQLKTMENELGVKLVERGARRITLTDAGVLLYKRANSILEMTDAAMKELEDYSERLSGTLRLGATSSSGPALLNRRMKVFSGAHPDVHFEIHEGNTFQLIELLGNGLIEIAIARTPFHAENTDSYGLKSEPLIAVADRKFFEGLDGEAVSLRKLQNSPLIIYRRFEKLILSACKQSEFKPVIFCKNDDARTSLMWADAGLGIAIVPQSMAPYRQNGQTAFKVLKDPSLRTQVTAIWRNDRPLSSVAKGFLEVFQDRNMEE